MRGPAPYCLVLAVVLCSAGCEPETRILPLALEAAAAPDSVLSGQPVLVKVYWHLFLEKVRPTEFIVVNDSTVDLNLFVETPTNTRGILRPVIAWQSAFLLLDPPRRPFVIRVKGNKTIELPVQIASALPVVERFRFHLRQESNGLPVEGIQVVLLDCEETDTLFIGQTGADGMAEVILGCDPASRPYAVMIDGYQFLSGLRAPAQCSVPERIVIPLGFP